MTPPMPSPTPSPSGDLVPALTDRLRAEVGQSVRKRLGLAAGAPIPPSVQSIIDTAVLTASRQAIELGVTKDAEQAANDTSVQVVFDGFAEKVSVARQGIDLIQGSQDVQAILQRRAELLWAKRRALEAAGFSSTEAMQIILAELGPRTR